MRNAITGTRNVAAAVANAARAMPEGWDRARPVPVRPVRITPK